MSSAWRTELNITVAYPQLWSTVHLLLLVSGFVAFGTEVPGGVVGADALEPRE
jgi:hypothetical protein